MFWFERVIKFISEQYVFATPDDLYNYKNTSSNKKIKVLLTFDDGFYTNRVVAETILKKYNVKAIFFITEGFVGLDEEQSFEFSKLNFYPNSQIDETKKSEYQSMSLQDIKWLKKDGHSVGAHTSTHKALSLLSSEDEATEEIIRSADKLEKDLDIEIDSFAFPYGDPISISPMALELSMRRFKYIFSNIRGSVSDSPNRSFIFRQNIAPEDPLWLVKLIIEGRLDWKYRKSRKLAFNFFGLT